MQKSSAGTRPVVTVCIRHYLPGYKSGGPVRSVANLVEQLGDEFDFRIVTSDRDIHDDRPYAGVAIDAWQPVGTAQVFYASTATQTLSGLAKVLNSVSGDLLYVNSFFDRNFTLLPLVARRLGLLRQRRAIVAPRGEFSAGALRIRAGKKKTFLMLARLVGLYSGVSWHASTELEAADIGRVMGCRAASRTFVAINLSAALLERSQEVWRPRAAGEPLRVIFVSRIAPKKNLDYALRVAASSAIPLVFNIYGMVDDAAYWKSCQELIARMPSHVSVTYRGALPHDSVGEALAAHDVLFLPTQGENFGHVVAESLMQGTPVLLSDRTPWRGLRDAGVGWDIPLEGTGRSFHEALETLAAMEADVSMQMRSRISRYAAARLRDPAAVEANRRLFRAAAQGNRSSAPAARDHVP